MVLHSQQTWIVMEAYGYWMALDGQRKEIAVVSWVT